VTLLTVLVGPATFIHVTIDPERLRALRVDERLAACPAFIRQIVELAREYVAPSRVVLFGSRARGRARARSDIDLAVEPGDERRWGRFTAEAEEQARTLLRLDLVNLRRCDPALRAAALREGILLYERA